eukprot:4640517-Pyramimonas_sp.AAC.1
MGFLPTQSERTSLSQDDQCFTGIAYSWSSAVAASRRSVSRMPSQPADLTLPAHREKKNFDTYYLYNPLTDGIRSVEQSYQVPAEFNQPRIAAAVAQG